MEKDQIVLKFKEHLDTSGHNLFSDITIQSLDTHLTFFFNSESDRVYSFLIADKIASIEKEYKRVLQKAPFSAQKILDKLLISLLFDTLRNISFYRITFYHRNDDRFFWNGDFDFMDYIDQNISTKEEQARIKKHFLSLQNNGGTESFLYMKNVLNSAYQQNKEIMRILLEDENI